MTTSTLDRISSSIGLPAAIGICRLYGGRQVWIPTSVGLDHPICVEIGTVAAERLCREFGGATLDVPSERSALIAHRNDVISRAYIAGTPVQTLAREHRLSRKMIHNILDALGIDRERSHVTRA